MTTSRHSWRFLQDVTEPVNEEAFAPQGQREGIGACAYRYCRRGD